MAASILTLHFLQFNVTRILTPLTTLFKGESFFASEYLRILTQSGAGLLEFFDRRRFRSRNVSSGGLKGNKAPGDAHPYLALC